MHGLYKITDLEKNESYMGTVGELEEITGINRLRIQWHATQGLLYLFRFRIERIRR